MQARTRCLPKWVWWRFCNGHPKDDCHRSELSHAFAVIAEGSPKYGVHYSKPSSCGRFHGTVQSKTEITSSSVPATQSVALLRRVSIEGLFRIFDPRSCVPCHNIFDRVCALHFDMVVTNGGCTMSTAPNCSCARVSRAVLVDLAISGATFEPTPYTWYQASPHPRAHNP